MTIFCSYASMSLVTSIAYSSPIDNYYQYKLDQTIMEFVDVPCALML